MNSVFRGPSIKNLTLTIQKNGARRKHQNNVDWDVRFLLCDVDDLILGKCVETPYPVLISDPRPLCSAKRREHPGGAVLIHPTCAAKHLC